MAKNATRTVVTLEFYDDGDLKSVSVGGKELSAATLRDPARIIKTNTVGLAFVKTEPASPAWCSMLIGGVLYRWQC